MKPVASLLLLASLLPAAEPPRSVGEAGKFDYYMLTLSWSPAFCAGPAGSRNEAQCGSGRRFAFILHGFWPQYLKPVDGSGWPQYCSAAPGLADPKTMLDIMPSFGLIRHEWERHGTCSGLDAERYFALARRAYSSVRIPPRFTNPADYQILSPAEVKRSFLDANPGFKPDSLVVACSSNFLSEVRICMDRNLRPIPCEGARECKAPSVRVPPVR